MAAINNEKKGYREVPLCDAHMHMGYPMRMDYCVQMLHTYMNYFGCQSVALLGLAHSSRRSATDPSNLLKLLYLKARMNGEHSGRDVYSFGSLYHFFDGRDTASGFERQVRALWDMGYDGVKLLLGKPQLRARLGVPLDDPIFDGFYRFCERTQYPVTMHVGDPAEYWLPGPDGKRAEYAALPSLPMLRREVDGILHRFPSLNLCLCHFYFMGDDLEGADRFLTAHEGVYFDLTPASEEYYAFSQRPDEWRDFFNRHARRILFGTDSENWDNPTPEHCEVCFSYPFNLVRNCLEARAPFRFEDRDYGPLNPVLPSRETQDAIYFGNFKRRMGAPRAAQARMARLLAGKLLSLYEHDLLKAGTEESWALNRKNLEQIYDFFGTVS